MLNFELKKDVTFSIKKMLNFVILDLKKNVEKKKIIIWNEIKTACHIGAKSSDLGRKLNENGRNFLKWLGQCKICMLL